MKYIIVFAIYCHNLEKEVNERINNGWEPIGGPFVNGSGWYQAMILK